MKPRHPFSMRLSIRSKLLLVSTSLLIIPWIGTRYVQEMEDYLREQQEEILLTRTQTVASILQGRPDLFTIQTSTPLPTRDVQHLFVRPLRNAPQLDGYLDDWSAYADRTQRFDQSHALHATETAAATFDLQVGSYQKFLYVALKVYDKHIVYRQPGSTRYERGDHVVIALENRDGEFATYQLSTIAPGWVNAQRRLAVTDEVEEEDTPRYEPEIRIKGEWQEFRGGYTVEFRIPIELIGPKISFAVADVNNKQQRNPDTVIATAGIADAASLATIIFPSTEVEQLLQRLQRPSTRTWVIDRHNRVIAQTGELVPGEPAHDEEYVVDVPPQSHSASLLSGFYSLLLKQPSTEFHDDRLNASRLDSEEFRNALQGSPTTRWRQTPQQETSILSAAHPVFAGGKVIGAVAIEQTSNSILLLQNRAMEILLNISALAFLIAVTVLLTFATRLSMRIRRLRDAAEQAITSDGRVVGEIGVTTATDEIGDLSHSFADMLARLSQYNRYLETMASKLSHELRTPITVVRSSLDNLDGPEHSPQTRVYIERAREGINRLNDILTRMSEATRLEQTLQSEQTQLFNLAAVVRSCVEGYQLAHPHIGFELAVPADVESSGNLRGSPELVAQMLDKLVSNAIDFHTPNTPIGVSLSTSNSDILLQIRNNGPGLPEDMQASLFDSMVSMREHRDTTPHLGLGLYIVRLIAEFHHGAVSASNLPDDSGVVFTVRLPLAPHQN